MRRIRYLTQNEYLITIGQKIAQTLTFSNCSNLLRRTWHKPMEDDFELSLSAKFNSNSMNGMQIYASLVQNGLTMSSNVESFVVSRVSESSWTETQVYTATATEYSPGKFSASVTQANLGSNELSGMETYSISCVANRKRKSFKKKVFVNHLGCFDSINRLRKSVELLIATKVDE